ncbi:MAG: LacI family transcriptional regulator [Clostridiales bacterium]|nr:LacI family transcriptional regulator [Clostridiales bacterium]
MRAGFYTGELGNIQMLTIREVAELAGVSKATVSRYINKSGYVKEETCRKIQEVIDKYHYVPAVGAVNLSKQESNTVGVIVSEVNNRFYGDVLRGIAEVADANNLTLMLFDTKGDPKKEARALDILQQYRVCGVAISPSVDYVGNPTGLELKTKLLHLDIPAVIMDRGQDQLPWDMVLFEDYQSTYFAARILCESGCKNLAIITGGTEGRVARDRYWGFTDGLAEQGIPLKEEHVYQGDFTIEKAHELFCDLFHGEDIPDGILTCSNRASIGFLQAATECGVELGKDIQVIGFDRLEYLEYLGIPYSCLYKDRVQMGKTAMQLLVNRIADREEPRNITVMPYQVQLCKGNKWDIIPAE